MSSSRVEDILDQLNSSAQPVLELLKQHDQPEFRGPWEQDARLDRAFAKKLVAADHPARAFELLRDGILRHPADLRLQYLRALALARSGNVTKATEYAETLLQTNGLEPQLRSDLLSLQGRLRKDLYQRTSAAAFARASAAFYKQAFAVAGDWFPGINAATMSLLAGEEELAEQLAADVIARAEADRRQPGREGDYWLLATLGEAHLLRHETAAARDCYRQAVAAALQRRNEGDVAAMRRNVQLLAARLEAAGELLGVFDLGAIVVFAGHLLDHPTRIVAADYQPRFPPVPELIAAVREAIRRKLEMVNARVGYSGVACGADLLFCEELLERGGALHVVLPFDREDFRESSVDFGLPGLMQEWSERYDRVLTGAFEVHYATHDRFLGDEELFAYGNIFAQGLALIRAARVGLEPRALCLLDPVSQGTVGTSDFRARWEGDGRRVDIIDLAALRRETIGDARPDPGPWRQALGRRRTVEQRPAPRACRAMLFADVKNYSQLDDERVPHFFVRFLDAVSDLVHRADVQALFANTWGDGLFLVFGDVLHCAESALELVERVERIDWREVGLPADTTVRVAVHAGPVYQHFDQIIRRENFFGSQVNRTARIEPVTTPGCVFASEQFAAELAVRSGHGYVAEYVGLERLAKDYDRCALYRLARGGTGG